ncbi:Kinase D-interacting substrate of 220 kDa [Phytophthora ramorum]|uniref:Kinase D-interacting substrate of 220 kDa n=1 Tax=Phytophthora ramorum TaxID=164328 RepID=UPI0030AF48AF|nr:Kinase D-interacting substrate of 220 kDa [Phytophthora ramorum]
MGNEQSTTNGSRSDGVPFVCWQCSPKQPPVSPAEDIDANLHSQNSVQVTSTSFHFAEPSSYRYDRVPRVVTGTVVFTNPPKADGELRNKAALLGNIAVVERGGRVHFPDIVRRLLAVGVTGIVFIERVDNKHAIQSLFDGFHSSGRQSVSIPIVLLAKYHADQLLADKPSRVSIELLWREQACRYVVPDDVYFGVQTAARAGDMELLKHLLEIDTTGDVVNNIPKAVALCDAAENGHVDCIEILHSLGVSLDEQKPTGVSPLMMACSVGNVEAARALLMFGASLDLEDVHGMTALMVAARDGRAACVRLLVKKGARINLSRNRSRGTTALHIAARGGLEECCSILLQGGAEIETLSPNSTTALMEAARAGNLGCVKVLVDAGASLVAKDRDGNTAEHLARMTGHTDIEDFLREQAESESVKNHRRKIEETVAKANSTLRDLLKIAKSSQMSVDILYREMIREHKSSIWLEQPRIIYEVFHLLTVPVSSSESDPTEDPNYGKYTVQHFCSEVALWYSPKIFQKGYKPGGAGWTLSISDGFDVEVSSGYLKVLFNFVCTAEPLDDVLLVLFCKVVNHFIVNQSLGELMWRFLADEGRFIVPWLVCHIGLDSIRDTVVWLLYSDMSEAGQLNVQKSGIFDCLFARLYSWQRTLGWGVGTAFQRDSVENICSLINYIIYPPSVYIMNNVATFVENTDHFLPLITDQHFPLHHNELFKSLLIFLLNTSDVSFGTLIDLGFAEVCRQCTQGCKSLVVREGGSLSIVMMLMGTLGYHKKKRDVTGIEGLLKTVYVSVLSALIPRVEKFVKLCRAVVTSDVNELRTMSTSYNPGSIKAVNTKGSALLHIITFLKRCVLLQSGDVDYFLANFGLMPCLLACYGSHPSNSMLHHELTDVIRFVLLDPDQKRLPSSPLLNSLFIEGANILDFVIRAYEEHVQYKGHMTTIANSIFTLTNTPNCRSGSVAITCQDVVRQYTSQHQKWVKFEQTLAEQNRVEMLPLGERNAPLCHGCLKLKQSAVEYVSATLTNADVDEYTGYLETIFSGAASHYCKVTYTDEFITGFMYKKDKIHDHIPIPEPTRVSSFIQFPVPMPFHALTFTITFFGLCQVCDKLWYCDTLQSANWTNRMKWVIPTSVRKWYSFGVTEGPGSGAHGLQFSSKGYKNFIVLTDTWGRQEQWMHAIEDAIQSLATQMSRGNTESAMAIEIDNEVDAEEFDVMRMREMTAGASNVVTAAPKSDSGSRSSRLSAEEDENGARRRSNTMSSLESDTEPLSGDFREDDDFGSDTSSPSQELTMPTVRSRSSIELKYSGSGSSSGPRKTNGAGDSRRKLDLKRFQPDTQKFSEILDKLKIGSPPHVNNARSPLSASGSFAPFAQRNVVSPHSGMNSRSAAELVGMRHVVSTPDLTRMQG